VDQNYSAKYDCEKDVRENEQAALQIPEPGWLIFFFLLLI
jgi:hypothetical protein